MSTRAHLLEKTRRAYGRLPRTLGQRAATPPQIGDLLVLVATADQGVEWAILARDPARPGSLLAVPADGQPLVGSADVAIPAAAPVGRLVLRCRFGGWFGAELFEQAAHTGTLLPGDVARALAKWSDLEQGTIIASVLEQETDDDLEYQSWVRETLAPARRALAGPSRASEGREVDPSQVVQATAEDPGSPLDVAGEPRRSRPFRPRFLAIAAFLFLALGAGLFGRQHQALLDLRARSEFTNQVYHQKIQRLTDELLRVEALEEQLRTDHLQELERLDDEKEELEGRLAEEVRQTVIVNPQATFLDPPQRTHRGEVRELRLTAEDSHLLLFISVKDPSPGRRYHAELIEEATGKRLWESSKLLEDLGELSLGFPAALLPQGRSTLRLFTLEGDKRALLVEYPLRIVKE